MIPELFYFSILLPVLFYFSTSLLFYQKKLKKPKSRKVEKSRDKPAKPSNIKVAREPGKPQITKSRKVLFLMFYFSTFRIWFLNSSTLLLFYFVAGFFYFSTFLLFYCVTGTFLLFYISDFVQELVYFVAFPLFYSSDFILVKLLPDCDLQTSHISLCFYNCLVGFLTKNIWLSELSKFVLKLFHFLLFAPFEQSFRCFWFLLRQKSLGTKQRNRAIQKSQEKPENPKAEKYFSTFLLFEFDFWTSLLFYFSNFLPELFRLFYFSITLPELLCFLLFGLRSRTYLLCSFSEK